jgi:hypothetical protein
MGQMRMRMAGDECLSVCVGDRQREKAREGELQTEEKARS